MFRWRQLRKDETTATTCCEVLSSLTPPGEVRACNRTSVLIELPPGRRCWLARLSEIERRWLGGRSRA